MANIYTKLLEFQKLGISIKKDRRNPHFKNEYASLNEVLDKVKKPLNDLGVVIVQAPTSNGVMTYLVDTDEPLNVTVESSDLDPWDKPEPKLNAGMFLECFIPFINATDMQKLGGAITYARRYALISMLALEDEDDDAETAVGAKSSPTAHTQDFNI